MNTNRYAAMVDDVTTIAAFFSDLTGGKWALALFCETLDEFLAADNIAGAAVVISKLYEAADHPLTWADQINTEEVSLFVDTLEDILS